MPISVTNSRMAAQQRDDVVVVRIIGLYRRQLQRQQFQFADQIAASLRGGAPPTAREVLIPGPHRP
jgi:hypothetical protein